MSLNMHTNRHAKQSNCGFMGVTVFEKPTTNDFPETFCLHFCSWMDEQKIYQTLLWHLKLFGPDQTESTSQEARREALVDARKSSMVHFFIIVFFKLWGNNSRKQFTPKLCIQVCCFLFKLWSQTAPGILNAKHAHNARRPGHIGTQNA